MSKKETITVDRVMKIPAEARPVGDAQIASLENKPKTMPTNGGGVVALFGPNAKKPKLKASLPKVLKQQGCRGATNCALESYRHCLCHQK